MLYLIAGAVVKANPQSEYMKQQMKPYLYEGAREADFSIETDRRHTDFVLGKNPALSFAEAEEICKAALFARQIVNFNGLAVHASAISFEGGAYLFSAASGVGKSTHTAFWQKEFSDRVRIINDDRPIVRLDENNTAWVYGTPFSGCSGRHENVCFPLKAVVFLKRADRNAVRRIEPAAAFFRLLENSRKKESRAYLEKAADVIGRLISAADYYEMDCTNEPQAAVEAYRTIVKK